MLEADWEFILSLQNTVVPGVPTCFYDTIPKYAPSNIQYSPTGITTDLTHLTAPESARAAAPSSQSTRHKPAAAATTSPSLSAEISSLRISVIYHTESMLQFKVMLVLQIPVVSTEFLWDGNYRNIFQSKSFFLELRMLKPRKVKARKSGDSRVGCGLRSTRVVHVL